MYSEIIVESFYCFDGGARHGHIHIRPVPGQSPYETDMFVECPNELKNAYPVGTKFQIRAKITNKQGGTPFIYTHYSWPYVVLKD